MKPTLKAPESDHWKLEHEKLLSNFAFKFNLRRYTVAHAICFWQAALWLVLYDEGGEVGWCRLTLSNLHLKRLDLSA